MPMLLTSLKQSGKILFLKIYKSNFLTNRKTGAIGREIRDMESQIKNEESRDLKSKIGKLSQDFTFLQKENASLATELKRKIK